MQTQTPALTPQSLSHLCARYLQTRFLIELNASPSPPICASVPPPDQPLLLPIPLASELDRIAVTLRDAWVNPVEINWDVACYANRLPKKPTSFQTQTSKKREAALMERYPPNDVTHTKISRPCVIQDKHGIVITWYLPGILNDSRKGEMMEATESLYSLLTMDMTSGNNWRNDPKNYYPGEKMPSGSINISPAWFQQGHETVQEHPQVSASLNSPAGLEWLDKISTSNMILSAILAVIHPELYEAGRETFRRLRGNAGCRHQDVHHVLDRWTSAFSGLAVISNRISPIHRDGGSRNNWYDLLVTLGSYQGCDLELPGLGISLDYPPGTVVGLSGTVVQHAVYGRKKDRMCYAYFMRDGVHEWAGVPGHRWMETKHYE